MLADCGFDIAESVGTMQARLHIPAFTKGKSQLTATEVEETSQHPNTCGTRDRLCQVEIYCKAQYRLHC